MPTKKCWQVKYQFSRPVVNGASTMAQGIAVTIGKDFAEAAANIVKFLGFNGIKEPEILEVIYVGEMV